MFSNPGAEPNRTEVLNPGAEVDSDGQSTYPPKPQKSKASVSNEVKLSKPTSNTLDSKEFTISNPTSESTDTLVPSEMLQLLHKISAKDVDLSRLCLLEEGHCMRAQVLELCDFHEKSWNKNYNFKYNAGSIDSLLRFVKQNQASTLLPYLAATGLTAVDQSKLSGFKDPMPYRSVGLLTHRYFVKHGVLEKLKQEIHTSLEKQLPDFLSNAQPLMPV
jgi:hypothetical protein